jgi:tetratricopeptide (TPR) repeat protein
MSWLVPALLAATALPAGTNRFAELVREAGVFYRLGQHREAEGKAAEALSLLEKNSSAADLGLAASLNNLASLLYAQGDLDRAGRLFERSRAAYQALAGPDDTRLATVLYNLAGVYVERGRYEQAEPLYQSALRIREKAFGAGHPLSAEVWNNLGFLCLHQGKQKEAEDWLAQALAVWEKSSGTDATYAALALNNLALLRRLQGGVDAAESLYQRALAIEEKSFGQDHPETATTRMNLAALYRLRGADEQAAQAYRQALAVLEEKVGAQDPLAVEIREQLVQLTAGEYQILVVRTKEEAEELRKRLDAGEDMAVLAAKHSIDPHASNGGRFRARPSELREELRLQLDRLAVGKLSGVFPLVGNWAIIQRLR